MNESIPTGDWAVPVSEARRIDAVCNDFEAAWRAGGRPSVCEFLTNFAGPAQTTLLRELVALEIFHRRRLGEAPNLEELLRRFPELESGWLQEALTPADTPPSATVTAKREMASPMDTATAGDHCGRYAVVRFHAKGGLGEVFLADDRELGRAVALKRIQSRFAADKDARQRFLREAAITARLEHPGVVPMYGLVQDDEGQPCYAMRFVRGDSLAEAIRRHHKDEAAAEKSLGFRQLLQRFIAVCQTVAYAHHEGVVHRDLKPANVMLGRYGETLLVDWGLAKEIEAKEQGSGIGEESFSRETPASAAGISPAATQQGEALGTPGYMSPEQAAGHWQAVGPASDIYSLGVMLYEILTGRRPFAGREAQAVLKQMVTGNFPRPCRIRTDVPKPLEAICLKAMALTPGDRYANANDLADDVERYLADEPVAAWQEPWANRARRWGRKHGALVAAAVVLLLAAAPLSIALAVVSDQARRQAEKDTKEVALQKDRAENEERIAQERADETNAALHFVEDYLLAAARPKDLAGGLGHDVTLADAVQAAVPFVATSFRQQPLIEARLRTTLGISFFHLGEAKLAAEQAERARELYLQHRGPHHPDTLMSMNNLGNAYFALGNQADALALREQTLALRRTYLGADHLDTFWSMHNLAMSYADVGRRDDAWRLLKETLALVRGKLGPDHPRTLQIMTSLASSYLLLERYTEALALYEETLKLERSLLGPDHPDTVLSLASLGCTLHKLDRHAEALKVNSEALALAKVGFGPTHPHTLRCMNNLAISFAAVGRSADAVKLQEETLPLMKARLGCDHLDTLRCMSNLGEGYIAQGRHAEALKILKQALASRQERLGANHIDTLVNMSNVGRCYQALGRFEEGLKIHEKTLALQRTTLGPDHSHTLCSMHNVATAYAALGRDAEAMKLREQTLALRKAKLGPEHAQTLDTMHDLGSSYVCLHQCVRGRQLYEELIAIEERLTATQEWNATLEATLAGDYTNLGIILADADRSAEALPWFAKANAKLAAILQKEPEHSLSRLNLRNTHWGRADALGKLARYMDALQDWDRAVALNANPFQERVLRYGRARALAHAGEHAKAVAEIDALAGVKDLPPDDFFGFACVLSIASSKVVDDDQGRERYAARAVEFIRQAVAKGYKDIAQLTTDDDLKALRDRDDYKKLLKELEHTKKEP